MEFKSPIRKIGMGSGIGSGIGGGIGKGVN